MGSLTEEASPPSFGGPWMAAIRDPSMLRLLGSPAEVALETFPLRAGVLGEGAHGRDTQQRRDGGVSGRRVEREATVASSSAVFESRRARGGGERGARSADGALVSALTIFPRALARLRVSHLLPAGAQG